MSATRKAWVVAVSIGAVEALKDQGFCRWNYALRCAKTNLRSYYQARRLSAAVISNYGDRKEKMKKTEEKMKKVMDLNCWGPHTIRF
ncbi:uncharacterized protein LOC132310476 [Cornus florida]|uniref:uncharacterized protein LOC132310476 n=1 Tax=Cornus florida TaxID=4283 RepID=UPI0028A026F5|nr:uncharacterized protein LOC132310476 [Cornus florida]